VHDSRAHTGELGLHIAATTERDVSGEAAAAHSECLILHRLVGDARRMRHALHAVPVRPAAERHPHVPALSRLVFVRPIG
jgi:hypothetical protein